MTGHTALHKAAAHGHVDVVRVLALMGSDVNARANEQQTPLHEAAGSGRLDVVRALCSLGADVHAQARRGATALHWASGNAHQVKTDALPLRSAQSLHMHPDS